MATPDNPVQTTDLDWEQLVRAAEGKDFDKPPIVYEFGGKRTFEDSGNNSGIYESK